MRILSLMLALLTSVGCHSAFRETYQQLQIPKTESKGGIEAVWMGTAGFYVSDGTTSVLIDPFVSRYGLLHVGLGRDIQPNPDAIREWMAMLKPANVSLVIVSHSHFDHAMDAPIFAALTGGVLVGSPSTLNVGKGVGLPEQQMFAIPVGKPVTAGNFKITFFESQHGKALFGRVPYPGSVDEPLEPPKPASAYKLGAAYSILVEHPKGTFLHHASAGWNPGMFKGVKADLVMLGIAGRGDSNEYVENVVRAVGAKRLLITHFDDFFVPLNEPIAQIWFVGFNEFVDTTRESFPDIKLETMPIGEPRVLFQ